MHRVVFGLALLFCAATGLAQEQAPPAASASPAAQADDAERLIQRGKYLVHDVAMCVVCHTPKTSDGKLITARLLQGAPIPVESPYPRQKWAFRAPALVGLGGFSEEAIVTLLQTGRRPGGETPQLPMPQYRMTEEDARAVAAYLKSLR